VENTELLSLGRGSRGHPWDSGGSSRATSCILVRGGDQAGLHQPDLNYAAAVHADKWIPVLPNTDAALQLAILHLIKEDTYDKEYVKPTRSDSTR